jgi:hypothetical protein
MSAILEMKSTQPARQLILGVSRFGKNRMIVRITGPAAAFGGDRKPISDVRTLQQLNGARADDTCENYLSPRLADLDVRGGQIHLVYDAADKELRVVTEYEVPARLGPRGGLTRCQAG